MIVRICRLAFILLPAVGLAACGGSNDSAMAPAPPPVVVTPAPQENAFGANFGAAFRAPDTAAPVTPADGDIVPLSLTTDPAKVG